MRRASVGGQARDASRAPPRRPGRPTERVPPEGTWARVLYDAREAAGLTRAQMARLLDVAPPQVTRWESGDVPIGEDVARRYAEALGKRARLTLE